MAGKRAPQNYPPLSTNTFWKQNSPNQKRGGHPAAATPFQIPFVWGGDSSPQKGGEPQGGPQPFCSLLKERRTHGNGAPG